MELSPVFTPIHQSHQKLVSPAQFWRTAKLSYILLYCLQHDIENITLNTDCSFEICVAEDAHFFVFHSFLLSTNYDLCKRSTEVIRRNQPDSGLRIGFADVPCCLPRSILSGMVRIRINEDEDFLELLPHLRHAHHAAESHRLHSGERGFQAFPDHKAAVIFTRQHHDEASFRALVSGASLLLFSVAGQIS